MWINLSTEELERLRAVFGHGRSVDPEIEVLAKKIDEALEAESDDIKEYRRMAMAESRDGEIEVDEGAVVSVSDDGGAYVMAWLWVEGTYCEDCGAMEGTPDWGTVGDGCDGLCGNCADKEDNQDDVG